MNFLNNKKPRQRIIKNNTPVFAYTNINAPVVKELSNNETVLIGNTIKNMDYSWYEVIFPDNKIGFILDSTEFEKDFMEEYMEGLENKTPLWLWYENPIYEAIIMVIFLILFIIIYGNGVKNTLAKFDSSNIIAFKINKDLLIKTSSSPIITYEGDLTFVVLYFGMFAVSFLTYYSFFEKKSIILYGLWIGFFLMYLLPGYVFLEEDFLVVKGLLSTKHYSYEQISNINTVKVIHRGRHNYSENTQIQLIINDRIKMILEDNRADNIHIKLKLLKAKVEMVNPRMD